MSGVQAADPLIQLPSIPLSGVQSILDGLKSRPLGEVEKLYPFLFQETKKQIDEVNARNQAEAEKAQPAAPTPIAKAAHQKSARRR